MLKTPLENLEKIALSITRGVGSTWSIIIHTVLFVGAFALILLGEEVDRILLILTTIVSLEAIYLSIFIQLSVNHQAKILASVGQDVDEISQDVEDLAENVEDIQENMEEIVEDAEMELQEDNGKTDSAF